MSGFFISIGVILAFLVSTYGWGRLIVKLLYDDTENYWAYSVTLGLASWIFLGGILNATRLAYPGALYSLFGMGLCFSLAFAYLSQHKTRIINSPLTSLQTILSKPQFITNLLTYVFPILMLVFLVATLMPTSAFNFHDDFHTYMARPVRMLQTGTVGGNPFDLLGIDSLGAQAFLQSFVLIRFPIEYINGFDAIFCFVLSAFLLIELARKIKVHWLYVVLSLLVFVFINPQLVNISSLYSGSLMILALIFSSLLLADSYDTPNIKIPLIRTIPVALFLSSLISLKFTFIFFAILYFAMYFGFSILLGGNRRRIAVIGLFSASTTAAVAVPWIAVYLTNYAMALYLEFRKVVHESSYSTYISLPRGVVSGLFSFDELLYGGSLLGYNFIVLMLAAACLMPVYLLKKSKSEIHNRYLILIISSCGAGIVSYFANAYFFDLNAAVRYSSPVFIVVLPAAVLILGQHSLGSRAASDVSIWRMSLINHLGIIIVVLQVILVGLFWNVFMTRAKRAYDNQTTISFPFDENYIRYNKAALSNQTKEWIRDIQYKVEEEQTILAWISVPFHLDFARNRILTVAEPGLVNPWLDIPLAADQEVLREYLRGWGVRYVIWEYRGYGMTTDQELQGYLRSPFSMYRKTAEYNLYFREVLNSLWKRSEIIYKDGRMVVFDIRKEGSEHDRGN